MAVMCARKEHRFNKCTDEREVDYQRWVGSVLSASWWKMKGVTCEEKEYWCKGVWAKERKVDYEHIGKTGRLTKGTVTLWKTGERQAGVTCGIGACFLSTAISVLMGQEGLQQDWQNMCGSSTDVGERENASRDEVLSWKGVDTVQRYGYSEVERRILRWLVNMWQVGAWITENVEDRLHRIVIYTEKDDCLI